MASTVQQNGSANGPDSEYTEVTLEQFMKMDESERSKLTKSRRKKLSKLEERQLQKSKKEQEAIAKMEEENRQRLERAALITIKMDETLPKAEMVKIRDMAGMVGKRVKVSGWVLHLRQDGKKLWFVDLRDGTGFLQCVMTGDMCCTVDALKMRRETSVTFWGTLVKDEKERAKGSYPGMELHVDYWERVGESPAEIENILTQDSAVDIKMKNRHLVIRGAHSSSVMRMRSIISHCFREHLHDRGYVELHPPTLVNTMCEGGSTLFKLDFFEEPAYLTQSSQMYLETGIPAVNDCFCILPSYRAEKSSTRRHLAEYHHVEAECPFITFDDLLDRIEDLVCDTIERIVEKASKFPGLIELACANGTKITPLKRPFKRMNYTDALKYCREHGIYKDEETKTHFEFGDDIPEAPERRMTDEIGEPILLCRFPASLKSFYMYKCPEDPRLTESVDLLLPGVGEVVGGSMRMWDEKEMTEAYKKEEMDPAPYYWYTDQRKFGSCPHGGYGLGLDRFVTYILGIHHIRDVCLYPRYRGRLEP